MARSRHQRHRRPDQRRAQRRGGADERHDRAGRIVFADQTDDHRVRPTPDTVLAALPEAAMNGTAAGLPGDLGEATALFDRSELARDTLGERLCEWYVANKRSEWDAYRVTVTDFDRDRYLRWL